MNARDALKNLSRENLTSIALNLRDGEVLILIAFSVSLKVSPRHFIGSSASLINFLQSGE